MRIVVLLFVLLANATARRYSAKYNAADQQDEGRPPPDANPHKRVQHKNDAYMKSVYTLDTVLKDLLQAKSSVNDVSYLHDLLNTDSNPSSNSPGFNNVSSSLISKSVFSKKHSESFPEKFENSSIEQVIDGALAEQLSKLVGDQGSKDGEGRSSDWASRVIGCARRYGVARCAFALAISRARRAASGEDFDLRTELERGLWPNLAAQPTARLDTQLADSLSDLFVGHHVRMSFFPGVQVDVDTENNGSYVLNIMKEPDIGEGRRKRKKWQKGFYRIIPVLLVPPLIMAAILPFVLPAMKLMTVGVVMLNQMALWGSIFTLMRNNAFQESYEKKVVYVNEGYKNEHKVPSYVASGELFGHSPHYFSKGNIKHKRKVPNYDNLAQSPSHKKPVVYPTLTTAGYGAENEEIMEYEEVGGGNTPYNVDNLDYEVGNKYQNMFNHPFANQQATKYYDNLGGFKKY